MSIYNWDEDQDYYDVDGLDWQTYEEMQNREDRQRDRRPHPDYLKRVKQDPSLEEVKKYSFEFGEGIGKPQIKELKKQIEADSALESELERVIEHAYMKGRCYEQQLQRDKVYKLKCNIAGAIHWLGFLYTLFMFGGQLYLVLGYPEDYASVVGALLIGFPQALIPFGISFVVKKHILTDDPAIFPWNNHFSRWFRLPPPTEADLARDRWDKKLMREASNPGVIYSDEEDKNK